MGTKNRFPMTTSALERLFAQLGKALTPPPVMSYSEWATEYFQMWGSGGNGDAFRPWKFQRGILDAIGDPTLPRVSVIKSARTGYALALDTPLATPSGWTTMGEVQVGDRLFDENGAPCTVTFKSEVFDDHECYRLTFDDGESIVADAGHRWYVQCRRSLGGLLEGGAKRSQRQVESFSGVITTQELARHCAGEKPQTIVVPVAAPLVGEQQDFAIPPYTMGLWIGDGFSRHLSIVQPVEDEEVIEYMKDEGCAVRVTPLKQKPDVLNIAVKRLPSGLKGITALKAVGAHCDELGSCRKKHIPREYLRASSAQRLALLQGLMDSDGTIGNDGFARFDTISPRLADDVAELIASLGMKVRVCPQPPREEGRHPQIIVRFRPFPEMNPFRLRRKAEKVQPSTRPTISTKRKIVSVEKVPSVPTQCISVDSPSRLFLAGRAMVPTHNTVSLIAAIAAMAANDPNAIMLLLPTDDDARGIAVDEIDPVFKNNPHLSGLMATGRFDGRNTLTQRALPGNGSLKINSARSPNNLRRHTVRTLFCDEVDGMKPTAEGDALKLAEKRTLSEADRKIVFGSTPTDDATSIIAKKYEESDQRIFEVPCIHCTQVFEMLWEHLTWRRGEPESVRCVCPHCKGEIEEKYKPQMVEDGEWRATRPHVKGHAGFRLNSLISQFSNASWVELVKEYETAEKNGPLEMQTFQNTVLGRVWSNAVDSVNENQLVARREQWGLCWSHADNKWRQDIPEDVAYITAGVDVQPDRLEITLLGWSRNHRYVLGHHIIRGAALLDTTWDELDAMLSTTWTHPLGGEIGIEAACVDSGYLTQRVYDFCEVVQGRRVVAIKGDDGPRPILKAQAKKKRNRTATHYVVGVDQVKTDILMSLPLANSDQNSIRFSEELDPDYFEQLVSERRELKRVGDKTVVKFIELPNRRREALDCLVYAIAAKQLCRFDYDNRYERLDGFKPVKPSLKDLAARLNR